MHGAVLQRIVTDENERMIDVRGRTVRFVVNPGGVELKRALRTVDSHRDWTDRCQSQLKARFIALRKIDEALGEWRSGSESFLGRKTHGVRCPDVRSIETTLSLDCFVRVGSFGIDSFVGLDVLKGRIHQTAVATLIAETSRTIHQILGGESNQLAAFQEVLTFQGTRGGECPTRTALTLILDHVGHCAFLSPI